LVGSQTYFTGHISSLYSTEWQKESTDHAVRYLDSLMIPLNKISVGIPFYGRQYRVSENHDHGLHQPAKFEKFVTMRQIRKNYTDIKGYISYWDAGAKATYKYYDRKKIFLTYDDERSVTAKTAYVKAKELNGIFFWELRLDKPNHGLLYTIAEGLQK
jgi:chitinase